MRAQAIGQIMQSQIANGPTADILTQTGWYNSWIGGKRRWHHKALHEHFKTLDEAKEIYRKNQCGAFTAAT